MRSLNSILRRSETYEALLTAGMAVIVWLVAVRYEAFENLYGWSRAHDGWELDELFILLMCLGFAATGFFIRRSWQLSAEVSRREAAEKAAQKLARHDPLTGLPNRRLFTEQLERALERAGRGQSVFAVLLLDLNRFKPINDVHGHKAGDLVLTTLAERLQRIARTGEDVARLGGDEFGLVVEFPPGGDAPIRLANRVAAAITEPIMLAGVRVDVGVSIGVALWPNDGMDAESLLRAADIAMYRAKASRDQFCFFEHSMEAEHRARTELERDLRVAIQGGEVVPYYQPLISLGRDHLLGFEILARWLHPSQGLIPPDRFIPLAEDAGLIDEVTFSLLQQACLQAATWPAHLTLAVNVSAGQLRTREFPHKVLEILTRNGFDPRRLEVEITETALVTDLAAAKRTLAVFQEQGVRIALDDFGTGYSSLYHLRELRFDSIKIDRSFVSSLGSSVESEKIIAAIIGLGKSLGMPALAEGIEDLGTLADLRRLGCEFGQGFLFSPPVPAAQVDALIRASAGGPHPSGRPFDGALPSRPRIVATR